MKDYYKILNLTESATLEEIKKSYKKLIKQWHPDLNSDNLKEAEEKTKEINEAYSVLKDEDKRKKYDLSRNLKDENLFSNGFPFGFNDFFRDFGNKPKEKVSQKGSDITVNIEITLKECIKGSNRAVKYKRMKTCSKCKGKGSKSEEMKTCSKCNGSGFITKEEYTPFGISRTSFECPFCQGFGRVFKEPCSHCKGEGVVLNKEELSVSIPKGALSGTILRVQQKGNLGKLGGEAGNLYIQIELKTNELIEVVNRDIYLEYPISMIQACLGDKVLIPCIEDDSKLEVLIPEGIQSGSKIKIQGKGIPYLNSNNRGDFYLRIKVLIPKNLSENQKELLRQFSNNGEGEDLK